MLLRSSKLIQIYGTTYKICQDIPIKVIFIFLVVVGKISIDNFTDIFQHNAVLVHRMFDLVNTIQNIAFFLVCHLLFILLSSFFTSGILLIFLRTSKTCFLEHPVTLARRFIMASLFMFKSILLF